MYREQKISVVIPCLNEEKGLPQVLSGRSSFVDEVLVVDNGSTDRSAEVAREWGARVVHEQRRGYGHACLTGLKAATGDIVVTLDADNNLLMSDVHPILDYMLDNRLDFVNGTRFPLVDRDLMPLPVRLTNRLITWLIRLLFRIPVKDSQCGFMAFRTSIIPRLVLSEPGMTFSQEVKIKVWTDPTLRAGERPIQYAKRTGKRKFKALVDSVEIICHAFAMRARIPARPRASDFCPSITPASGSITMDSSDRRPRSRVIAMGSLLILSLVVAWGFYADSRALDYSGFVTDQLSMLSICVPKDYPGSLSHDMVAGQPGSDRFYIPAYVNLVRFMSLPDHDYVQGMSRWLFVTTLLYMVGWWLLLSIWVSPWNALALTLLVRMVLPLPGGETWGVGGIWTMLPRTLFLALLPWVLWIWLRPGRGRAGWIFVGLFTGLLVNIHPLSAIAVLAGILTGEGVRMWVNRRPAGELARCLLIGVVCAIAGALPLLLSSGFGKIGAPLDICAYREALMLRVPHDVLYPSLYLRQWMHPALLLFMLAPPLLLFWPAASLWRERRSELLVLGGFACGCAMVALGAVAIQHLLQEAGRPVFFATYMIRGVKYMLVPVVIAWAMLTETAAGMLASRWSWGRRSVVAGVLLLLSGLLVLRLLPTVAPRLVHNPVRFFWPEWVGPRLPPINAGQNDNMEGALQWVRNHTRVDECFVGPLILRVAARRSVIHDHKGASFLIDNNPGAFLVWAKREHEQRMVERNAPDLLPALYRSWYADYWVTTQHVDNTRIAYQDAWWYVYDLRYRNP